MVLVQIVNYFTQERYVYRMSTVFSNLLTVKKNV